MKRRTQVTVWSAVALLAGSLVPAFSAVPRKQPLGRYAELWTKSPFTVPPVVVGPEKEEENPLEDYTLAGVCELRGGWFVVLINKKERDKRLRIKPGEKNSEGFQVLEVKKGSGYLETEVQIQTPGGKKGTVTYDQKFLVLKKATPRAPVGKPAGKPGAKPAQPPVPVRSSSGRTSGRPSSPTRPTSSGARPSRVRRVPTPPSR